MGNSCLQRRRRRREHRMDMDLDNDIHTQFFMELSLAGALSSQFPESNLTSLDLFADGTDEQNYVRLRRFLQILITHFHSSNLDSLIRILVFHIHTYCQQEDQCLSVIRVLVEEVPISESLACSIFNLILTDCCLPTKEFVGELMETLRFPDLPHLPEVMQKNSFLVIVTFSEKCIGRLSTAMITPDLARFIYLCLQSVVAMRIPQMIKTGGKRVEKLIPADKLQVAVAALLALQSCMVTSETKARMTSLLDEEVRRHSPGSSFSHLLMELEKLYSLSLFSVVHEVGSLSQLILDNYFETTDRTKTYLRVDKSNLNVILSSKQCTETIKIFANGCEVRSDAFSFESIRATFPVSRGCSYYEVTLVTDGIMQIGWTTKSSKFFSHEGNGVGDDPESVGVDGCRQNIWFKATPDSKFYTPLPKWTRGDVVGCMLDQDSREVRFSLNGQWATPFTGLFEDEEAESSRANCAFFPAVSLMSNQQCIFNFGRTPFRYPPKHKTWINMNEQGSLTEEELTILPWVEIMRKRKAIAIATDYTALCVICADSPSSTTLLPCKHQGFCKTCPKLLTHCPLCRAEISTFGPSSEQPS